MVITNFNLQGSQVRKGGRLVWTNPWTLFSHWNLNSVAKKKLLEEIFGKGHLSPFPPHTPSICAYGCDVILRPTHQRKVKLFVWKDPAFSLATTTFTYHESLFTWLSLSWNRRNTVSYMKKYPRFMPKKLKVHTRLDHVIRPRKLENTNSAANCNTETSEWDSVRHKGVFFFYFVLCVLTRRSYFDPFWDSKWIGVSTFWGFIVLCFSILIKCP